MSTKVDLTGSECTFYGTRVGEANRVGMKVKDPALSLQRTERRGRGTLGVVGGPRPYDFFSMVKLVVVPCSLSLYSAWMDLPSAETVMR